MTITIYGPSVGSGGGVSYTITEGPPDVLVILNLIDGITTFGKITFNSNDFKK